MRIAQLVVTLSLAATPLLVACSSGGEDPVVGVGDDEAAEELKAAKTFKCGDQLQCDRKKEYCMVMKGPGAPPQQGHVVQSFTHYTCEDLPSACGTKPTCACLSGSGMCSGKSTTGLTRTVMMM